VRFRTVLNGVLMVVLLVVVNGLCFGMAWLQSGLR
jgi:hypothetical protein